MARRFRFEFRFLQLLPVDAPLPTSFVRKLETGVGAGDCLPACLACLLECLARGCVMTPDLQPAARLMRHHVCRWIKSHWLDYCAFNSDLKVHEIVHLLHDLSIPTAERRAKGAWGDDAADQLKKYERCCDSLYFSDVELLCFACMLWETRQIPVLFRVFRVVEDAQSQGGWAGSLITVTPEPATLQRVTGQPKALIVDIAHVGGVDEPNSHFKLLPTSSLEGLTRCAQQHAEAPSPESRKRLQTECDETVCVLD
jgi:hypothetical protein